MKVINTRFLILLILVLISFTTWADNWPVGSGGQPSRHSLSTESGPEAANLVWQNGVSSVIAQQAVIDGNIVAMSRITNINNVLHGSSIVAQNLETGDTLWTKDLPVDFPSTDWRNRVSAINNGVVYATRSGNTNYSYMFALDATDGTILWQSDGLVNESSTESCAFASNGDLIVGNFDNIIRINHTDGTTVWQTDRSCPTSNGQEVSVFGNKGYFWEPSPSGPVVSVIDLETGNKLYSSEALSAGLIQQLGLMIGSDGIIFAPRSMNNPTTDFLFALEDNGGGFTVLWSTPIGYIPFSTGGIGPDGSIYTYSPNGEVMRLDPSDGSVLNTSENIFTSTGASPRMAIDANGYVFVTNGEFSTGKLFSFNPDLTTRWTENITNVNIGGPAIGQNGTMVVCGVGTNVRAYEGSYSLLAGFSVDNTEVCAENMVQFNDQSNGNITSWEWTFDGGEPATSALPDPVVYYAGPGTYDVSLIVSDGTNTDSLTTEDYISVLELPEVGFDPITDDICEGDPPYELFEGTPEGGIYSGPGVDNGFFYPDLAGVGIHNLSYYYVNPEGCGDTAFQEIQVMICDGIADNAKFSKFRIFPNPATDVVTIHGSASLSGKLEIEIFAATMAKVCSTKISVEKNIEFNLAIPLNKISPGICFIKLQMNGETFAVKKLVVASQKH
ncbi:MAG: PQQ-binding-like beta-propeller repeat protein [Bacteroidales bacterium]|nr:PQQ-binding-like beta-propeller repeat protein [Bacteroidales bacterium]